MPSTKFTAQPASSMPFVSANYREDFVGSVPIIRVMEGRRTLYLLLRLFYLMDSPDLSELANIRVVLRALVKYMIDSYAQTVHSALFNRSCGKCPGERHGVPLRSSKDSEHRTVDDAGESLPLSLACTSRRSRTGLRGRLSALAAISRSLQSDSPASHAVTALDPPLLELRPRRRAQFFGIQKCTCSRNRT
ncbi:hypothetical protein EW146_g5719 [Bondarzewia mesenterica]|uniref:Uncharacterized protein n=1 Tax=Bondarzewia mesenterica TaxID=1095465 RepID=A0A4S4LQP6_9AGAM|nr:hypothetical protein EW146_g5719 [Bondarzewia mesenterica]